MTVFNRLLVFALGLVLAAFGFVMAIEAAWTGLGYRFLWFPGPKWLHSLRTSAWSDRSVMVGAAVIAAIGLALLVAELRPWPKRLARLCIKHEEIWLIQRHSAEQYVMRAVANEVPRTPVKAGLRIGKRRWLLRLRANAATSTKPNLEAAGRRELTKLGAPLGSRVAVRTARSRRAS
jgi:hypothetical protein